jgi:replicative DNA helicase
MIDAIKAPPHCIDSEHAVIGGLLHEPHAIDRIDWLPETAFYGSANRAIYRAQRKILEAGAGLDVFLLATELGAELEKVGGIGYLSELQLNTPSAVNIHRYAAVVRDKALLRNMVTLGMEIQERAMALDAKPAELAEELESRMNDTAAGREESEAVEFHKSLDAAFASRSTQHSGIHCGFPDLDRIIKPMRGGDLIIVAGRPSMGKSALATCIAEHVAREQPVGFWSLEMGRASIAERILGWHERNDENAAAKLASLQLYIDTPYSLSIGSLRLRMKRLRRRHGLALAVVDYLQLMRGDGENRTQEIGSISRGLKRLAVEMDIPLIAVCQLNRGVEQRTDKRPMLSDLRESGDIEQDADIAIMVYREEYYDANTPAVGTGELLVRKHRNGRTGMARLTFISEHARFESYAGPDIYYEAPRTAPRTGRLSAVDTKSRAGGE